MSSQHGTYTDKLNNVIQVIQLGRKTGLLTVQRGESSFIEEGEIAFYRGQITHARLGQWQDQQALLQLQNWKGCLFTFVSYDAERITGPQTPVTNPSSPTIRQLSPTQPPRQETGHNMQIWSAPSPGGQRVPQRLREIKSSLWLLEQSGLSRHHRRLLLLIDGHRNIVELSRLMGRSQNEVQRLLQELANIGIVQ
jgi:hypothetical protein